MKEAFENILGQGENAGHQHFLFFQPCFLPFPKQNLFLTHIHFVIRKSSQLRLT